MGTFTGRVAVVTGAAGGIGSATARRLAADGADLALWDLDDERLAPVAAQCRAAGVTVTTSVVDQTDPAAVEAGTEAAVADHGRIDVLAAVAGWGAAGTLLIWTSTCGVATSTSS